MMSRYWGRIDGVPLQAFFGFVYGMRWHMTALNLREHTYIPLDLL